MLSPKAETGTCPLLRDLPRCVPWAEDVTPRLKDKAPGSEHHRPPPTPSFPVLSNTPRSPHTRVFPAWIALSEAMTVHLARGQLLTWGKPRH